MKVGGSRLQNEPLRMQYVLLNDNYTVRQIRGVFERIVRCHFVSELVSLLPSEVTDVMFIVYSGTT